METRPESSEALVARLLPDINCDPEDRAVAWEEWVVGRGADAVLAFVRTANDTPEPDAEIVQEAITTAYVEVERGRYEPRRDVPFTAYVKGIARNKIREARRRGWRTVPLDERPPAFLETTPHPMERLVERREQVRLLQQQMAQLPSCQRQVLEGYLGGQSTEEIAHTLGITTDSVRQHKSRGLRRLRSAIRGAFAAVVETGLRPI